MTLDTNLDPSELLAVGYGLVIVGSEDATPPTAIEDIPDDLTGDWVSLGFLTEDGPQFTFDRATTNKKGWQSLATLRTLITEFPTQVEGELMQWNQDTIKLALGGAVIESAGAGVVIQPEDASFLDIRQLIIYGVDGEKHYGFYFPRCQNTRALSFPWQRTDTSSLPFGMEVLEPSDDTPRFQIFTDDPAVEADEVSP